MVGVSILCSTTGGAERRSNSPLPDDEPSLPIPSPDTAAPMSSPAHQARPLPVITMARTFRSASASSSRSDRLLSMGTVMVFIRSGRLNVITATCWRTS